MKPKPMFKSKLKAVLKPELRPQPRPQPTFKVGREDLDGIVTVTVTDGERQDLWRPARLMGTGKKDLWEQASLICTSKTDENKQNCLGQAKSLVTSKKQ